MSGSVSSLEGELNYIVKEYMDYLNLDTALRVFEEECQRLGRPIQENESGSRKDERILKLQGEMFSFFDSGDRESFMLRWEEQISESIREEDVFCQKLEFQLQLHFAVSPLRDSDSKTKQQHQPDCSRFGMLRKRPMSSLEEKFPKQVVVEGTTQEAMNYFRYYLETKGAILSHDPEVLPYFALPYIPEPQVHPSFAALFEESWVPNLRRKLETFLWEALKDSTYATYHPRLVELYQCSDMVLEDVRNELKTATAKLEESESRNSLQNKQLFRLQDDYQRLMLVSAHLVSVIEAAVQGDLAQIDAMLTAASQHFPELFQARGKSVEMPNCSSSIALAQHMKETLHRQSLELLDPVLVPLDYRKVKRDLVILDPKAKMCLLQALRWRLTKSYTEEQQELVLASYIANDLLGCEKLSHYRKQMVIMLKSCHRDLLQCLSRLFNAFASFKRGRTYLAMCPEYLTVLQEHLLKNRNIDMVTRNMILGVLQKLSLRHMLQLSMIEGNIIEWLMDNLQNVEELDEYSLEYSAALLMNLCLNHAGQEKCKKNMERVLQVLIKLLKSNRTEVLPYVNGALYSLISDLEVRKHAQEMGLKETMEAVKVEISASTHQQIDFVLTKLASDEQEELYAENIIEDEDEDEIEVEPEVDMDDFFHEDCKEIGEKLLTDRYADISAYSPHATTTPSSTKHPNRSKRSTNSMERGPSRMPRLDPAATELVRRLTGEPSKTIVQAENTVNPSQAAMKMEGLDAHEYTLAFSSRPKIPRSPEPDEILYTKDSEEEDSAPPSAVSIGNPAYESQLRKHI